MPKKTHHRGRLPELLFGLIRARRVDGSTLGEEARSVKSRLDARLRLVYRAQREAASAQGTRPEADVNEYFR
jgi:hypothetical protein